MRRRQLKKQKKIIIISSLCLLLCLCVGYAAYGTQLSIRAKGNIIDNSVDITDNVVNEGDGLYEDAYEDGRYIYRGQSPDNYIEFNGELWRIIAKETDGTYKIIRNLSLPGYMAFDEANHRSTEKNSYCSSPRYGCGVFAAVEGTFTTPSGSYSGTVTEDSSIKIYLNDDYYVNDINETAKGQMTSHLFNIGAVEIDDDSIGKSILGEKMYTWVGDVGLPNVSDILKASTNPLCTSIARAYPNTDNCNSNYLLVNNEESSYFFYLLINANAIFPHKVFSAAAWSSYAYIEDTASAYITGLVRPVVFLKADITLSGKGTEEEPYVINE